MLNPTLSNFFMLMCQNNCCMFKLVYFLSGILSVTLYGVGIVQTYGLDFFASDLIIDSGNEDYSISNFMKGSIEILTSPNSTDSNSTNSNNVTVPNFNMTNKSNGPNTTLPEQIPPETVNGSKVGKI